MTDKENIRSIIERLVQNLEESRMRTFRSPIEIAVTEIQLTDIAVKILDIINSALVNFILIPHMEDVGHVDS
jgi:hypothetical protein